MSTFNRTIVTIFAVVAVLALGAVAFAWSGIYNIGADDPHLAPTHALLEKLREQSIKRHAASITVPDLNNPAKAVQGAGNYNAMCVGCHLAPGVDGTELSRGLYPSPPDLTRYEVESASAFWVIKHGIKASAMPAWGPSMDDQYIWNMVAFLKRLPGMGEATYRDMVAQSGGHSHGGGETDHHVPDGQAADHHGGQESAEEHDHDAAAAGAADHHEHDKQPVTDTPTSDPGVTMQSHRHADGTVESHPVKAEPAKHEHADKDPPEK